MKRIMNPRAGAAVCVLLAFVTLGFVMSPSPPASAQAADAAWISLSIENSKPKGSLDLIAGQDYVFQRIVLAVDHRIRDDADST